jgi:uncharacterized protein (TIGR02147 family)
METEGLPRKAPQLPDVWEYTDYRSWLTDTFQARKAIHSWYSYGVLAQRSGFKARDFLMRVMRGERRLSSDGAERLADALDLPRREKIYFLALVEYNQARKDQEREIAWARMQEALARGRRASGPRLLTGIHREILSEWHHLAIRSILEMNPDPGNWDALGKRLDPARTEAVVRKSVQLLEKGGLVEQGSDGLWRATGKSVSTTPEVTGPALRNFHRDCLELAGRSLEETPVTQRSVTGLTLGISERTYRLLCERMAQVHEEISRLAEVDEEADRVYQVTTAIFPLSRQELSEVKP